MIEWGIELSNETGLPIYIEASPSTYLLYRRMGFEILPEKVIHKGEVIGTPNDIEVPLMAYMPACAKGLTFAEWRQRGFPLLEEEDKNGAKVNGSKVVANGTKVNVKNSEGEKCN